MSRPVSASSTIKNSREEIPNSNSTPPRTSSSSRPPDEEVAQVIGEDKEGDTFLVDWEPGEEANPQNWSTNYKSWITFQLGMLALAASLGSSIIAPAESDIAQYTGISLEASILVISVYVSHLDFSMTNKN